MESRCCLFIILVFNLVFRLVSKLAFLFFNVNVYLKEIPCLNKVTLPYELEDGVRNRKKVLPSIHASRLFMKSPFNIAGINRPFSIY